MVLGGSGAWTAIDCPRPLGVYCKTQSCTKIVEEVKIWEREEASEQELGPTTMYNVKTTTTLKAVGTRGLQSALTLAAGDRPYLFSHP